MKVKNIMFSGFAAAILMGAVDANAAGLSIASQEYVDSKVGAEKTARENEDTAINNKIGGSYTAQSTVHAAIESKASQADFDTLNTTVTAAGTGLVAKVAALEEKAGTDSVESQINAKLGELGTNATTGKENTVAEALAANSAADQAYAKNYADGLATNYQAASASNVTDLADGSHLTAGNGVAANLKALDTNLRTAESTIASHTTSIANNATAISTEKARAEGAESGLSTRITDNENAIDAINNETNGILAQAKSYADGIVSGENGLSTQVTANKNAIDAINNETNGIAAVAAADATTKAGQALTDAKAYTDTKVSDLANGAVKANADAIAALNDTYATDADVNAKFGGVANALPGYATCTAESGQCVLSVDKTTGALTWVAVTPAPASGN